MVMSSRTTVRFGSPNFLNPSVSDVFSDEEEQAEDNQIYNYVNVLNQEAELRQHRHFAAIYRFGRLLAVEIDRTICRGTQQSWIATR